MVSETLRYTFCAIAAAHAGRGEMHCGIPLCPKFIQVRSDANLIKWVAPVHFWETWNHTLAHTSDFGLEDTFPVQAPPTFSEATN